LAYSSQENAIVERNNKEINRHLRALTFHTNTVDNYQLGLPFVQRIMNSSHNERTEIAPFQILFGNSIDLERGILTPFEEILPTPISLTKTSSDLLYLQKQYITIAKDILQKSDAEHIATNSAQITEFAPNTYVLVQNHSAPETRLHTLWRGPMKVIKSIKGQYTLLDLTTLKEKEYHSTQLKEFIFNPTRIIPLDVARKDYLEFFIEKILHHTGNTNRLSSLHFKVKWQGYDDTYNSYEPWKNLRSTEQLHLYLIRQNLKHLIPKQHQASY
jgi:hypothetical protein